MKGHFSQAFLVYLYLYKTAALEHLMSPQCGDIRCTFCSPSFAYCSFNNLSDLEVKEKRLGKGNKMYFWKHDFFVMVTMQEFKSISKE